MQPDDDMKAARQMRLPWWGVLCWMIVCALIMWLFDSLGRFDLARPTLYGIGMLGVAIAIKWKLRRHVWFWITMTGIVALHVLLILVVPWTTKWVPAIVVIPIGILSVVGKFMEAPKTSER
jgi:chromate transport protein ChrA